MLIQIILYKFKNNTLFEKESDSDFKLYNKICKTTKKLLYLCANNNHNDVKLTIKTKRHEKDYSYRNNSSY